MMNARQSVGIIAMTAALALVLPFLVQHGMFMDGTQYAIVSRNLAEGSGTFWSPFLSPTWQRAGSSAFMEQPPLFYFLEAQFISVVGDTVYAERIFCLICLLVTIVLIRSHWNLINRAQPSIKELWWLPAVLFISTPVVFWTYRNNMIEMTVTVMVLAASLFTLRAILTAKNWPLLVAAVFIFCGTLCKGLPSLFIIALPFCWRLVFGGSRYSSTKMAIQTAILLLATGAIFTILFFASNEAKNSLTFYFTERVARRITDEPLVENRFSTLTWMVSELVVILIVYIAILLISRKKFLKEIPKAPAVFFLCVGLSGILPLMLTTVQRSFYMVPAFPFLALGAAWMIAPRILVILSEIGARGQKFLQMSAWIMVAGLITLTISKVGDTSRDKLLLDDVHAIGKALNSGDTIAASYEIYSKWDFQFYLLRYYKISIAGSERLPMKYSLKKNKEGCPPTYKDCDLDLNEHTLCRQDP